jgi:hypothetical protein
MTAVKALDMRSLENEGKPTKTTKVKNSELQQKEAEAPAAAEDNR